MYLPRHHRAPERRRGIILLVVLAMLTLFAVVGLTFVFYADAEAVSSRIARESEVQSLPDVDPEMAFALFLNQLLYDADDTNGVYSAMRGMSLARSTYGYNPQDPSNPPNSVPFNGVGRLHEPITFTVNGQPVQVDGYNLVNYMAFMNATGQPVDGFLRDPERLGTRANLAAAPGQFTGGFNVPYTYPDLNNMFLAAVKADGTVLVPSFHRNWTGFNTLDPANPNWLIPSSQDPTLKYKVMRPRPIDMYYKLLANGQPDPKNFPLPEDAGGDVKNLVGAPGGNDSIWMDLGAPVMTLPDGRKFKMLFAPLIMDLDGRVNVNAHGNIRAQANGYAHSSDMGIGPWEVNLQYVLSKQPGGTYEWPNLFIGRSQPNSKPYILGKYGADQYYPALKGATLPGTSGIPHFYAWVDYDGVTTYPGGVPTSAISLPGQGTLAYTCFPAYPAGYGNNAAMLSTESLNHPALYNAFKTALFDKTNDDRVFAASNLAGLLRYGDTGSEFLTSELAMLCPTNFADPRIRRLVTTHSFDINRPGASPWIYDYLNPPGGKRFTFPATYPVGTAIDFPPLANRTTPPAGYPTNGTDFTTDWRYSRVTVSQQINTLAIPAFTFSYDNAFRLDLDQSLPDFPAVGANGVIDLPAPGGNPPATAAQTANLTQYNSALQARITLAAQIYYTLVRATGTFDPYTFNANAMPNPIQPSLAEINCLRWLAQLAVNMVDYLDKDDYITPFNWAQFGNPGFGTYVNNTVGVAGSDWVYGTELPRVVINEVYAEYTNTPNDPSLPGAASTYSVNFWVELYNGFNQDTTLPDYILNPNPNAPNLAYTSVGRLQIPANNATGPANPIPVYQLLITQPNSKLTDPANTLGNPDNNANQVLSTMNSWTNAANMQVDTTVVLPVNPNGAVDPTGVAYGSQYAAPNFVNAQTMAKNQGNQGNNVGFYVVGPTTPFPFDPTIYPNDPNKLTIAPSATLQSPQMSAVFPVGLLNPLPVPTVMLQRLACPNLPLQNNPAMANYNPYVTVDYMDNINVSNNIAQNITDVAGNKINLTPIPTRASVGRYQPYAAFTGPPAAPGFLLTQAPQLYVNANTNPAVAANSPYMNQPQHTLFQCNCNGAQNGFAATPGPNTAITGDWPAAAPMGYPSFDWLVHLDRPLVSAPEALQVSANKPHLLTHTFMTMTGPAPGGIQRFQHVAPWFDDNTHLYRFFEFIQTHPQAAGANLNGRVAGRINLNTIWDPEVLLGLCDPQPSAGLSYIQSDIYLPLSPVSPVANPTNPPTLDDPVNPQTVYWRMMKLRLGLKPGESLLTVTAPRGTDQPFLSLASTGFIPSGIQYPNGAGTQNTFFCSGDGSTGAVAGINPAMPRLFQRAQNKQLVPNGPFTVVDPNPALNPYLKYQLMTKIFNNVTTRSNVFGVWVTVGFFEVMDDSVRPVKLGAEIGRSEGRQVRHRMFTIVDRSVLTLFSTTSTAAIAAGSSVVTPAQMNGTTASGVPWSIQGPSPGPPATVGTILDIDTGPNLETVTVTAATAANFTANFQYKHAAGCVITARGNPGPQARFNPHSDPALIPYFSIID